MKKLFISDKLIEDFRLHLISEERSPSTISKYQHEVQNFKQWCKNNSVSKELVSNWKYWLQSQQFSPSTINGKLAALNSFFAFANWQDCRVKALKLQRKIFRDSARELSRDEYTVLLETARRLGKNRLLLIMETICSTGIRVSELRYITLEAARAGKAVIYLKGKIRTILIPGKLGRKLTKYAGKNKITSGEIFLTRGGNPLSRKQIWSEMKSLCRKAGIEPTKVFPHNLRHLFARCFYQARRDIVMLADVLGHSSIETTRIYLISTGEEHSRTLENLKLVS